MAWKPNPGPQTAFLMCPVREILFGGAKGGGKTDAIGPKVLKHVKACGKWARVLILRESYPQLSEIIQRMRPICLRAKAKYNKVDKTWTFPSGATITFGHTSDGCDPYWGKEYTLIVIDEVTRTVKTEQDYRMLLGSLRSSHGIPCGIILTSNPGGIGHAWVKARFMGVPPLTIQVEETRIQLPSGEIVVIKLERVYIPAKLSDNPHLPLEYWAQLDGMGEKEKAAYLGGDWSAFEGTIFKLIQGIHTWTWKQFKERTGQDRPPLEWTRFRSLDWGYAHPFACYWYAVDYDGRAFVYREYYGIVKDSKDQIIPNEGARLEPGKVAEKIASIEKETGEKIVTGWAGPDIGFEVRQDQGGGKKIEDHFRDHRVFWQYWTASAGSRLAGKMALHQRLAYEQGEDGSILEWPGIIFITEECPHAIRTIPALEYDQHQPEQVDSDGEDHGYDSISGFCKMKPWNPKKKEESESPYSRRNEKKKPVTYPGLGR